MSLDVVELKEQWHGCTRCGLSKLRSGERIVFGLGPDHPKYLFVYDTPTEVDADAALPMAGQEGDLLASLLTEAGIAIADVYCTPLVGCRPTMVLPATDTEPEREVDRSPSAEEYAACAPRWQQLLYRLDPQLVFTLGPKAYLTFVRGADRETCTTVEKAAGKLFKTRLSGRYLEEVHYDVIPLLSMQQIFAKPSHAAHGPMASTIRYLSKGKQYVEFIERRITEDARAAQQG